MTENSNELPEEGKVTPSSENLELKGKEIKKNSEESPKAEEVEKEPEDNSEGEVSPAGESIVEAVEELQVIEPSTVKSQAKSTEPEALELAETTPEVVSNIDSEETSADESNSTEEIAEEASAVEVAKGEGESDSVEEEAKEEVLPLADPKLDEAKTEAASDSKEEDEKGEAPVEEVKVEETKKDEVSDSEEEEGKEEEEEVEEIDLTSLDKTALLGLIREKVGHPLPQKVDKLIHEIKTAFHLITTKEREVALVAFKTEGGLEDDFDFKPSEEEKEFDGYFFEFRRKVSSLRKDAERQKERNLEAKNILLDKLRELVDGEETTLSMNAIKAIQDEWKAIGPVPAAQNRSLWASYNALMDRFYDNRSIYFELKELDRKKNLVSKTELCEKAEALKEEEDLQAAIKVLNELHEEYKHLGPVPREEQEALWQRFKAASDAVYDRRKEFYDGQKEVFQKNLELKEALIKSLEEFTSFTADRIREWNGKTKEILAIQKTWEQIGPVPRESGREVNKTFWAGFKQFFHNKNLFFKKLDEVRAENQKKAEELIVRADELADSTDWQKTANQMIGLQKEWKTLGPTPEKTRDALYKKFKTACDTFFDNRRNANKEANSEYEANLESKRALCKEIEDSANAESPNEDELTGFVAKFNELGFVPRKNMKEIQGQFKSAVDKYLEKLDLEGVGRDNFLFKLNLNKIQSDPNAAKTFNKKEHGIRKQISELENSITLWKTNLEFFAASKTADKLKDQFDVKIQKAEDEISKLKEKLSILRDF